MQHIVYPITQLFPSPTHLPWILHTKNTCKPLATSIQIRLLKKKIAVQKKKIVLPEGPLFIYICSDWNRVSLGEMKGTKEHR